MRINTVGKHNIFLNEDELDSEKISSGNQKVKFDIEFLGCVECSTNGDLLGKSIISVPPSSSIDAEAGGEINCFLNQSHFNLCI